MVTLDQNITNIEEGFYRSMLGEAHQHIVAGILLRLGFYVTTSPIRTGAYDIIIVAFTDRTNDPHNTVLLRAQCKTIKNSLRFVGGLRGGTDRIYIRPSPKEYKYTEKHNDLIIGTDSVTLDMYIYPTRFIDIWGNSVSKKKIQALRIILKSC